MKIIPKLGLHRLRDAELDDYAKDKQDKITDSGNFPGVDPSVPVVMNKVEQYRNALSAAASGTPADTEVKNVLRDELEDLLTRQALDCAAIANGDMGLYLTSGYAAKDTHGTPVGELDKVLKLVVKPTDTIGEIAVSWEGVEKAQNYTIRAYTDESNPEASALFSDVVSGGKATLTGMPSGSRVFVAVRANGGSTGHGAWSNSAWTRAL